MEKNSWRFYLIYSAILIAYLFLTQALQSFHTILTRNFGTGFPLFDIIIYFFLPLIINIILGILIGGEYINQEFKKHGRWQINYKKLICVGLPLFFISVYIYLYYWGGLFLLPETVSKLIISGNSSISQFSEIILGYTIATSIRKEVTE